MSVRARRWATFALALMLLGGSAVAVALRRPEGPQGDHTRAERRSPGASVGRFRAGVLRHPVLAPRERPDREAVAPPRAQHAADAAGDTARRFLAAYARYEVGDVGRAVRAGLRATAARRFADELLARPPLPAPGAERPPRARLHAATFVPVAGTRLAGTVLAELVRAGRRETLELTMHEARGPWRVTSIR
jgi:hypothetical protein